MAVTFSVLVLLSGAVFVLVRYAGLRVMHALVCILAGFYLASSSLAPAGAHGRKTAASGGP